MSSTDNLLANAQPVGFACPEKCLVRTYGSCNDTRFYHNASNTSSTWSLASTRSSINLDYEKHQLGQKKGIHRLRAFRYRIFYISRRIFSVVLIANLIPLLVILSSPKEKRLERFAIATSANITASALIRQDHIVNLLFAIACSVPTSAPLWIRRRCAQIHHIGGLDQGLGIAIIFWLSAFTVLATMQHAATSVLVIAYLNLILLLSILLFSRPIFRPLFRGHFETTMRFAGWTSLLLFWIKAGLFVSSRAGLEPVSKALLKSPSIWLMTVTTISILSTWFEVRKVPVKTYILSPHAIRLDFCASSPLGKAVPGTAVRISSSLLGEWYTFPTIAQPGQEGFSVIVANPKGWAAGLVANPPTELYIRGLPTTGFMRVIPLFRSMLLVVSGSGIAALLPQLYALDYAMLCGRDMRAMPRLRILWSAEDPEGVFGREVVELILRVDPWAVICDKRGLGRPDMLGTAWRLVRESGCEAVGVVGSQGLVGEVVYGLESRGVPAFGALWSS